MSLPVFKPFTATEVPLIDVGPMLKGDAIAARRIAREMSDASRNLGFFYVINHGIPQQRVDRMFELAHRFFALPLEEKMALRLALTDNYRGYLPMRMMGADLSLKGNLHEGFQIHSELPPEDPDVKAGKPLHGGNVWPASLPELRDEMLRHYADMSALSLTFLRMFAIGLELPEDAFTRFFRKPMMQLRYLRYPAQEPTDPGEHLGTRPHTDSGAVTFLAQDEVGGLEILNRDGDWINVPPVKGSFVVNIGEMLKVWTDGIFASTPHRVINRFGKERFSMPFFATPDYEAVIRPIMKNPDHADDAPTFATSVDKSQPITCGEILLKLYGRIWPSTRVQRVD